MSVRVVARIRPLLRSELDKDTIVSADTNTSEADAPLNLVRIPNPKNAAELYSFQFNRVYDSNVTQQEFYEGEVAPTIKHLFSGYDVTLFAYGVTGTGKTHTMRGGKSLADRGVIPRLLSGIYRRARKIEKDSKGDSSVAVIMSYYEIYNDRVFDLFEPPEKRTPTGLPLRDAGGKTVVVGLSERPCESLRDFEKLYDQANVNRSTGATKLNAHSSRSHAILCVKVVVTTGDQVRTSTASAIDLAGSEDNRRTDNNKERLVESSSINKSLFVLAQCVEAISKKAIRIPYRESRMTRILSLGQNNGFTIMILNLAPIKAYHLDTLSSLNFANRTKKIEVRETENEPVFKGCARPVPIAATTQRQPLQTLTSANHNANVRRSADLTIKPDPNKKPKSFAVYSDTSKNTTSLVRRASSHKRLSPLKRPSESQAISNRPAKAVRSIPLAATSANRQPAMSKAIEDLIEKKVAEMLASRALESKVAPQPDISEEVRKRLEVLERKIEDHEAEEDGSAEGLHFLLMAKQHLVRGEDGSALRMFELARPHFPDNGKLERKIARLREKLEAKRNYNAISQAFDADRADEPVGRGSFDRSRARNSLVGLPLARPVEIKPIKTPQKVFNVDNTFDASFAPSDASETGTPPPPKPSTRLRRSNPHPRQPSLSSFPLHRPTASVASVTSTDGLTPRTSRLLAIVNSRDAAQMRLLRGVGAKKAAALVEAVGEARRDSGADGSYDDSEDGIASLAELGGLRGVGVKTVERWREGLGFGVLAGGDEYSF